MWGVKEVTFLKLCEMNLSYLQFGQKIKVFGNDKFKSERVDIVLLILVGKEKLVTIEAICYPMKIFRIK